MPCLRRGSALECSGDIREFALYQHIREVLVADFGGGDHSCFFAGERLYSDLDSKHGRHAGHALDAEEAPLSEKGYMKSLPFQNLNQKALSLIDIHRQLAASL